MDVRGVFAGAVEPPERRSALAWWFAFAADRLVVREVDETIELPLVAEPEDLGLVPEGRHYLGLLDGRDCWALDLGRDPAQVLPEGYTARQLRGLYSRIEDDLFALAGRAVQVVEWGRNHRFCGRCGTATEAMPGERAKRCPACGLITYPRLSPAVIVQVTRGDRILLARNANFPA
ncbi:MAG TPA: NUDIX-like domain-containing protein, partial [Thermomicrobiales bacterium]